MSNEEIRSALAKARFALESVFVQGKSNLGNLYGGIDVIDNLLQELSNPEIPDPDE